MSTISISTFSKEAASKSKGLILNEKLRTLLDNNDAEIYVDFTEISRFASPFFNNSFGALALVYGFDKINSIKIINITDIGMDAYQTSMENAQLLSNSVPFIQKIDEIINNVPKKVEP